MDFYGFTLLLRWILGWFIQPKLARLPEESSNTKLSVIIPARNEEKSLPNLLNSLSNSELKPDEIIVVDDHSTDKTYEIATKFNTKVITSKELPQGWTGKSFALMQGASIAKNEKLVFLDADTKLDKSALGKLNKAHETHQGLVSVQPFHHMTYTYERFASVFNLIGSIGARLGEKNGLVFGPVMMLSKSDLEHIGGFVKVKNQLLEDRALGFEFQKHNLSVHTFIGAKDISFQMYPDGWKSLTQGFTKNMAAGSAGISKSRWLLLFTWFSGLVAAAWELPFAFLAWPFTNQAPSLYQYVLTIGFGFQFWWFVRKLGNFNFYLILYPFMILYFLVIFFYSVVKTWQGKVIWKDRILDAKKGLK
ncbi:MAG: glycosyltransferase [Candidatus Nanopelagicales bacterium]|jgi:glycosyltransferase involved in cell wall biosynthesis